MSKHTVVDRVVESIIDQVINGQLTPGDRLPTEPELCGQLGAGRNSVREAIKKLEAYGVVLIRRADGTYISDHYDQRLLDPVLYQLILQKQSFGDFVQLRHVIAIGTVHMLARLPQVDLSPIREALSSLQAELHRDMPDAATLQDLDAAFHVSIARVLNNPQLYRMTEYITRITLPSRVEAIEDMLRMNTRDNFYLLHQHILDAIEKRELAQIDRALEGHYVHWKDELVAE